MIDFTTIEHVGGMCVLSETASDLEKARMRAEYWLRDLGADKYVDLSFREFAGQRFLHISPNLRLQAAVPDHDTTRISSLLKLNVEESDDDLLLEILLAAATSPIAFVFPSVGEFFAAARMRFNIVKAARRTELSFDPNGLERPEDCWTFSQSTGFVLKPGASLIDALEKALFPDLSGRRYTFSCQRASEYLILLALAKELEHTNPALLERIQSQWAQKALVADHFLHAFLFERGSALRPFPMRCLIPGGRLWFKNPDDHSSDVQGYEGSWVCYLGAGKFVNFWDKSTPYTLETKCVEIYHWRHAVYQDRDGHLRIDEDLVQIKMRETMADRDQLNAVLGTMMKYRDPAGVYAEGGCIDLTRDSLRWILPETSRIDLQLHG